MTDVSPGATLRGAVDLSSLRNRPATPSGGSAGPSADGAEPPSGRVPSLVMDVTDASFGQVLELSRTVPVVVDLWAEWCGPCKQLSPALERVVRELNGRIVLAKVDVDANPQLAQAFRAQSIPMVVGVVAGQPVPLFTGAVPDQQVREVFAQFLQARVVQGQLRIDDVALASSQFFSLLKGELHPMMACGLCLDPGPDEVARHIDATVEFFLRAYAA